MTFILYHWETLIIYVFIFLLGYATAYVVFCLKARRKQEERKRKREMKRAAETKVASIQPPPQSPQPVPDTAEKLTVSQVKEKRPSAVSFVNNSREESRDAAPESGTGKPVEQFFSEFEAVETLKLNFNYLAPDNGSSCFVQGEGYVRNTRNELLPDRQTFQCINTCTSYAKSGLFWAFDVSYKGKVYSYRQVLNGEIGCSYVQIFAVRRPAAVERQAGLPYYRLLKKGLLEVAAP